MTRIGRFIGLVFRNLWPDMRDFLCIIGIVTTVVYGGRAIFLLTPPMMQAWTLLTLFGTAIVLALLETIVKPTVRFHRDSWRRSNG